MVGWILYTNNENGSNEISMACMNLCMHVCKKRLGKTEDNLLRN